MIIMGGEDKDKDKDMSGHRQRDSQSVPRVWRSACWERRKGGREEGRGKRNWRGGVGVGEEKEREGEGGRERREEGGEERERS